MDAARSPERRVKMKLTTRTVRHTKAASHSLRNTNHFILDNYDSERVTARRCRTLEWRHMNLHVNLPVFSAYARNVLANMPKPTAAAAALIRHPELSSNEFQCVQARGHHVSSFATGGGTGQGNACQTLSRRQIGRRRARNSPGRKNRGTRWRTRAPEIDHRRPSIPPPGGGTLRTRASRRSNHNIRASTFRKWRFASSSAYGRKADIRRNADVG